ncbi:hypothetical protein N7494_005042 [Penicillium frequentans]|uniref:Uncharacterized protein n=1 Tax=Penicillium frequentans TaxID=3151616 RepID=A0AAD6D217_9EURO|nr:hypothetical protein N7494_005042 [Penicillium glabrum]
MGLDFPTNRNGWQFDLVGLLAVIGESIIDEIVQPLTPSPSTLLPRLLLAPHAFIRPSRRTALLSTPITGAGVYSGATIDSIPYFAAMVHQVDLFQPYEFQGMTIKLKLDRFHLQIAN